MALEDNQSAATHVPQFLKVRKDGIGQEAVSYLIKEGDVLVAIDGELFLGDSEALKAAFDDYDPTIVDDVAWLITFWREGTFFNLCFKAPLRAKFDFVTPEEGILLSEGFSKLVFGPIDAYQNFEIFRDLKKNASLHSTKSDPLASYAPLLWMLNNRLYYPMLAIIIVYGVTAVTSTLLFVLSYILVCLYAKRAQLNLLRSYHLFEDKFFWLVVGATSETEARESCKALDSDVKFRFDKENLPQKLNRIQRKNARENQSTSDN